MIESQKKSLYQRMLLRKMMNSSYTYIFKSAIIFVSLYSLLVSGFSDATKNKTRIVGRHVHFFYQLESLVFSSFDNIREVPYPPSRVSAFQALVEIPVDIKNRKNAKPNATIKEMRNETKRNELTKGNLYYYSFWMNLLV